MPILDNLLDDKASHIPDRNRYAARSTLCGQPLNVANYWMAEENFERATCKTCRALYFDDKLPDSS